MAKAMRTGIIRFNLQDRGRQYTGKERHFDVKRVASIINSKRVQERVKLGDLNGYYGHLARIEFGLEPKEGGIVNGKMVYLEPCCRTVYLRAYEDGTVEHQQEFFDTELGRKAWQRLQDKSGGFSSVISLKGGGDFHGFDYVNEPNYDDNRPYAAFDDIHCNEHMGVVVLDDTNERLLNNEILHLMDCVEIYVNDNAKLLNENKLLSESLAHLQLEHQGVLDDIVVLNEKLAEKAKPTQTLFSESSALDSVIHQAEIFRSAKVEKLEDEIETDVKTAQRAKINRLMGRYGY